MSFSLRTIAIGAAAGAAGTAALNAATYVDMAVRGRPASSTPEQTVEKIVERLPVDVPGEGETRDNRIAGLAPLSGTVAGVAGGAVAATARAVLQRPGFGGSLATAFAVGMLVGNGPMTFLGISDPRSWSAADWASDVLPHLAYGAVAAAVLVAAD